MLANSVGGKVVKEGREGQKEDEKSGIAVINRGHFSKNWHKIRDQVFKTLVPVWKVDCRGTESD